MPIGKPPKKPFDLSHETIPGKKTYTPEDVRTGNPAYGKESKTKPTPDFVKQAQAQKKDIVMKGNLPYRAGRTTTEPSQIKMKTKIDVTPEIKKVKQTSITPEKKTFKTQTSTSSTGKSSGKQPMRKLARVPWATNKEAKGYTSSERRRKKTQSGY